MNEKIELRVTDLDSGETWVTTLGAFSDDNRDTPDVIDEAARLLPGESVAMGMGFRVERIGGAA